MPPLSSGIISTRRLGDMNRATVLRELVVDGPLSRAALADRAGVTRATIGVIIQVLLDAGIVEETGAPAGTRGVGKPSRPLQITPGAGLVIAIKVDGSEIFGALVDATGRVTERRSKAIADPADAREVGMAVVGIARTLHRRGQAIGVGISVPGRCDSDNARVIGSLQVPGAIGDHLPRRVASATGLEVRLTNDTRAHAVAEHWFGQGRALDTFATVQTGDGLGAGLMLDGMVHRGPNGAAGEIGHAIVAAGGDLCRCGKEGCWETIATLPWLRKRARALGIPRSATVTAASLEALAATGDQPAAGLLDEYAAHLAIGLVNLQQTSGANVMLLHGDASNGGAAFLARVRAAVAPLSEDELDVRATELSDAALLGAAGVVLVDLLHTVGTA